MVTDFEATVLALSDLKPCGVTKVYAITKENKDDGTFNAWNSFNSAVPLAHDRMGSTSDPITAVPEDPTKPDGEKLKLQEYVGNPSNTTPTSTVSYLTATAVALRSVLIETAKLGQSSAIFWTSDGLHVLGGAILGEDSNVPAKPARGVENRGAI